MLTQFKNFDLTDMRKFIEKDRKILVGIHFLSDKIRFIKVLFEKDEQELLNAYTLNLPSDLSDSAWLTKPEKLSEFIKNNINCKVFANYDAVAVLDTGMTCIRELHMPILSEQELAQAIKWDALQYLPYNEDDYVYGYNSYAWSNDYGEGININLLATQACISGAVLAVCKNLDVKLSKMTVAALALNEFVQSKYLNFAILDIEDDSAQVTVFADNRPLQNTVINIGLNSFAKLVAEHIHLSQTQALVLLSDRNSLLQALQDNQALSDAVDVLLCELLNQASMAIEKYLFDKPGQLLEVLLLAGSLHVLNSRLKKYVSVQLNIHVEQLNPLEGVYLADAVSINTDSEKLAAVMGAVLLLHRNDRFSLVVFDNRLRTGYKLCKWITAICVIGFVGLLIYESAMLYSYKSDYQLLSRDHDKIAVWRKRSELINKLELDSDKREKLIDNLRLEITAWPQVLLALGYSIPDNVSIISIVKARDEDNYILRGKTEQIADLKQFIANLQKTKAFQSITLQHVSEGVVLSTYKEFTISLKGMGKSDAEDNKPMEEQSSRQ